MRESEPMEGVVWWMRLKTGRTEQSGKMMIFSICSESGLFPQVLHPASNETGYVNGVTLTRSYLSYARGVVSHTDSQSVKRTGKFAVGLTS